MILFIIIIIIWIRENSTPQKAHFVGSGERVKPRLSQALIKDALPDSNSRPAVQISNLLSSRYAPLIQRYYLLSLRLLRGIHEKKNILLHDKIYSHKFLI